MPHIALPEGVSIHCAIDDYLCLGMTARRF
jgi:hypothetical protein